MTDKKVKEVKLSNKILVTYESNWADEMDIQASIITTLEEWNKICEQAKEAFNQRSICTHHMGNMEIEYHTYTEWLACYTVKELTNTEYKVLTKFDNLLNKYKFFIPEY